MEALATHTKPAALTQLAHRLAALHPKKMWQMLTAPVRIVAFVWKIVKNGHYDVVSTFEMGNKEMTFRTFIQLDGDVINYLPNPKTYANSPKKLQKYRGYHAEHLDSTNTVFKLHQENMLAFSRLIDFLLLSLNYFSWLHELLASPEELLKLLMSLKAFLIILGTLLFRKYLKPWTLKKIVKGFFFGLRKTAENF